MRLALAVLIFQTMFGATSISPVVQTTSAEARIEYNTTHVGACTWEVSESSTYTPLVHDVNSAIFTGANSDARTGTVIDAIGTRRVFVVGKRTGHLNAAGTRAYSRALTPATQHYARVTCGGETATVQFQTRTIPLGNTKPRPFPWGVGGDYLWPDFNYSDRTECVNDPMTGIKICPMSWGGDYSNKTIYKLNGKSTDNYVCAGGWSNCANATAGSTATLATYSGAGGEALAVGIDPWSVIAGGSTVGGYNILQVPEDIGIVVYGSGSDATASNRQITLCLGYLTAAPVCESEAITVTLPQTTPANLGTFPAAFPKYGYDSWDAGKPWMTYKMRGLHMNTRGKATVSAGAVTITGNYFGGNIDTTAWPSTDLVVGQKVWISGSSPTCPHNLCTIAAVTGATTSTTFTISENVTIGTATDFGFPVLAVIAKKTTAAGTVSVSFDLHLAWGVGEDNTSTSGTDHCSHAEVTAGDGKIGRTCLVHTFGTVPAWAFLGRDGTTRILSTFHNYGTCVGCAASDTPGGIVATTSPVIDKQNPNVIYTFLRCNSNNDVCLYKLTYTGNYSDLGINYPTGTGGEQPSVPSDQVTWENLTKPSEGRSVNTQFIAANPSYNIAFMDDLVSGFSGRGTTGNTVMTVVHANGQEGICWLSLWNTSTGAHVKTVNSFDGSYDGLRWSGCHAADATGVPGFYYHIPVVLQVGASFKKLGGPFTTSTSGTGCKYTNISTCSTNTSLPATADGSYYDVCPANSYGATTPNCFTVEVERDVCSAVPATGEAAAYPCPGDGAKSRLQPTAPGDAMQNVTGGELFRIITRTDCTLGGCSASTANRLKFVLQRFVDANTLGPYCGPGIAHSDDFTMRVDVPGVCIYGIGYFNDFDSEYQFGGAFIRGHFNTGVGGAPSRYRIINAGTQTTADLASTDLTSNYSYTLTLDPPYGTASGITQSAKLQSYPSITQWGAAGIDRRWALDWQHINGGLGLGPEAFASSIGSNTATLQGGTTSVYRLSIISSMDASTYKQVGILGWAGRYLLGEKSTTNTGAHTLTDSDSWRFCYAYRAGECRTGSAAGEAFVVTPNVNPDGQCHTSIMALGLPCLISRNPLSAMVIQRFADRTDMTGRWLRPLTAALSGPGRQYHFSNVVTNADSSWMLMPGIWTGYRGTHAILGKLPPFQEDSAVRTAPMKIAVQVPARGGATHARIRFGYAIHGDPATTMYCTARQDDCVTDEAVAPFAYLIGDAASLSAKACASGCTITVPADPDSVLYYKIEWLTGAAGATVATSAVDTISVN